MPSQLSHFAINADDVDASRSFYSAVFGWTFEAWGPPGFFHIDSGGVRGALQQRRAPTDGFPAVGVECTFAVDDIDATIRTVTAAGGEIVMPRFTITGVGHLIFFKDPAGNAIGAMQYDSNAA
jgi:uncharacterized protein